MIQKKWFIITLIVLACGIADSAYLVHHHYWVNILHPDAKSFCSVNEVLDCDEVALSPYATIGIFPVATIGVFAYSSLFFLLILAYYFDYKRLNIYLSFSYLITSLMFAFSLFEALASVFMLGKLCIMCSILYICVIVLLATLRMSFSDSVISIFKNTGFLIKEAFIFTDSRFIRTGVVTLFIGYFLAISVDYYFRTEMIEQVMEKYKQQKSLSQSGLEFLEENKNQPGVIVLESGLQYKIIRVGNGQQPKPTDYVFVNYNGKLTNGLEVDNTYAEQEPILIDLTTVIPGWKEGIPMMKEGAKWRFFIPPHLAYGQRSIGTKIPKNATLIFDIELVSIDK